MRALVVAAHPDDEVLGCGGTIARLVAEGHEVFIAILGEGITSRYPNREQTEPGLLDRLKACSRKAAQALGAKDLFNFSLPDNRFDTVPLLEVIKLLENLLGRLKPQVVYTQHGGDLNVDHAVTFRAALTATRPVPGCAVRNVYAYEVASSTEWAFQQFGPTFHPTLFVNIADTLARKLQAMSCYDTEAREFPHPRSPEALRAIAQRWGSVAGLAAAEAFECIREIR